jgi:hypothetical protein
MSEVTLTYWEGRICTFTGKQRWANANALERDPGQGPPHDNDRMDIRGAHCEFAASIMLNLYWRPTIGEIKGRDVGGLVEVRSTVLGNGRLIVKPKDVVKSPDVPFALILADMDTLRFRFGGWMFARDAKAFSLNSDHGDPAYFIEQSDLSGRPDLMTWLEGKR